MRSAAFYTLGCKVNQYETDAIQKQFEDKGYEIVPFDGQADIYVINTCSVTAMSDKKSRQIIHRAVRQNSQALVVAVGCYSQNQPEQVAAIEGVHLVVGTSGRATLVEEIEQLLPQEKKIKVSDIMQARFFEEMPAEFAPGRTRAALKIQEGCDRYCSYCIIPYTRGPVRSRPLPGILQEASALAAHSYQEVVLTGIHVASYGKDLSLKDPTCPDLAGVIEEISQIPGIERIRLSSVEPLLITPQFLQRVRRVPSFCPHFHLSLQSGCDQTLKRMNRRYTTLAYRQAVERIRACYPESSITTDIITGFPGETEAEFTITQKFLEEIGLYEMHIFPYSQRPGTPAALLPGQVPVSVRQARAQSLIALSKTLKERSDQAMVGQEAQVLFEQHEGRIARGHTMSYRTVQVSAQSPQEAKELCNQIRAVRLETVEPQGALRGVLVG